jgi:hypothetical protein
MLVVSDAGGGICVVLGDSVCEGRGAVRAWPLSLALILVWKTFSKRAPGTLPGPSWADPDGSSLLSS